MTLEEVERLKRGDTVTRNGETGTVISLYIGFRPGQGPVVNVEWASGREGSVGYRELERA
jgi:hypothetical protein